MTATLTLQGTIERLRFDYLNYKTKARQTIDQLTRFSMIANELLKDVNKLHADRARVIQSSELTQLLQFTYTTPQILEDITLLRVIIDEIQLNLQAKKS